MPKSNDWRLTNQANYLMNACLRYKPYQKPSEHWDHDHCAFCWAKFMDATDPNVMPNALHEGYTLVNHAKFPDDYHWVCITCFKDFKEKFQWKVIS